MRRVLFFCFGLVLLTGLSRAEESTPQRLAAPTNVLTSGAVIGEEYSNSYIAFIWESDADWFEVQVEKQGARIVSEYWPNTTHISTTVLDYSRWNWFFFEEYDEDELSSLGTFTFKVRAVTGTESNETFTPSANPELFSEWASLDFTLEPTASGLIKPEGLKVSGGVTQGALEATENRIFTWKMPFTEQRCQIEIYLGESIETGKYVSTKFGQSGSATWECEQENAAKGTYSWRIRGVNSDDPWIKVTDSTAWTVGPNFELENDYTVELLPLAVPSGITVTVDSSPTCNLFVFMQWANQDALFEMKILNPDGSLLFEQQGMSYMFNYSPEQYNNHPAFTQGGTYTVQVRAVRYSDDNAMFVVIDSSAWASQTFFIKKLAAPVFVAPRGNYFDSVLVDVRCEEPDAKIILTIRTTVSEYTGPFYLDETKTLRAYAKCPMMISSDEVSIKYYIDEEDSFVGPVTVPAEGSYKDSVEVSLVCYQPGAKVYYSYRDGDLALYSEPFVIRESALLRAIAVLEKDGNRIESDTLKVNYTITSGEEPEQVVPDTVARPVFVGWSAEVYQDSALVELKCDTADAEIYYRRATVDTFALYTTAFYIHDTTKIYAFATKENLVNSDTVFAIYNVGKTVITDTGSNHEPEPVVPDTVARPVFVGWSAEVYHDSAWVELKCDTADAEIYYRRATVDTFAKYTVAFYIYDNTTIYAFAAKEGLINSDTVLAVYYVAKTPVEDTTGPSVRNEENVLAGVKLYPNPSTGTIHLNLPCRANVEVFTLSGTVVLRENSVEGLRTYTLSRSGLYLVRVSEGEKMTVRKVTIR